MAQHPHLQVMTHLSAVLVGLRDYLLNLRPNLLLRSNLAHTLDGLFLHEALDVILLHRNANRLMRLAERRVAILVALLIQGREAATLSLIISRQINSTPIMSRSGCILIVGVAVNGRVVK